MPKIKSRRNCLHESTQQVSSGYLREFTLQYKNYVENKSDENLILIQRNVSLLTTLSPAQFKVENLETAHFFVNLHALMKILDDNDVLWTCVALLQNCSRNPEARLAMMNNYRFVPLLTHLLTRTQLLSEKATRLLTLLQELTYNIQITWPEPYIHVLLEVLEQTICAAAKEDGEKQAQLALSVLCNVCYRNTPVIFLFIRTVKSMSEFSRQIQAAFGPLASKLLIILSEDLHSPDQNELHLFLRSTFASMQQSLKDWNIVHIQHMIDFLLDSKSHAGLHNAMLNYENFCVDIERLLNVLSVNDSEEETFKQRELCHSMFFKLISYVLELSAQKVETGHENVISLDAIISDIFDLVWNCMESSVCGTAAVQLMDDLIRWTETEKIVPRIAREPSMIAKLITIVENTDTSSTHTNVILQLLLRLLQQSKTDKLILTKISESFFDKIFEPLLNAVPQSLPVQEAEKTIHALLLLINFANIAKKAYFEKCCTILQMTQIQYALALATLNGDAAVCEAIFQIAQFEHFPRIEISRMIAKLNTSRNENFKLEPSGAYQTNNELTNSPNLSEIHKTDRQFFSAKTEERLTALIENISLAQRNNQLGSISTTQMVELYNYEIDRYKSLKQNLQHCLDQASNEKTKLLQQINLTEAELQKTQHFNFELHTKIESLETQSRDLAAQRENFKKNYTNLVKKTADQTEKLQITEKRLTVKVSELIALQKEHADIQDELRANIGLLEKLEAQSKENISKIDKLKKSITAFESEIKDKEQNLDAKEREIVKINKALEVEREAKKKADGVIAVLEQQIQEKNEELRNYENELSETEELRKTIMSLMESKKPKRKN